MKKRIFPLLFAALCVLCLSACGCRHETWNEADCVRAKTCAACGETEGEPLGHQWQEADCARAKTCSRCGGTEGEALGHDWVAADCENPEICARCAEIRGEAVGHSWLEATTENPETCENCGLTRGSRIITDRRFQTDACKALFGIWEAQVELTGDRMGSQLAEYVDSIQVVYRLEMRSDGDAILTVQAVDPEVIREVMRAVTVEQMYSELEKSGVNRQEANREMLAQYGMTLEKMVETMLAELDINEMFSTLCKAYVYYVRDGQFYLGDSWNEMEKRDCSWEGDTMILSLDDLDGMEVTFTRVAEEAEPDA